MQIKPFRPYMYSKDIPHFWSPPFDTINSAQERELKSNEFNITHLTLPRGENGIAEAHDKFYNWVKKSVLSQSDREVIILVSQTFNHHGMALTRNGIISLIRVFPDDGSVKPHEKTFEGPRKGRVEVMSGLGLIPEPIFLVVPGRSFKDTVHQTISLLEPVEEFDEPEGVHNRIFLVTESSWVSKMTDLLKDEIAVVADGHHRLAALKELAAERNGPWNYILSYIASAEDPALLISGIHRLIRKQIDVPSIMKRAESLFEIVEVNGVSEHSITLFDGAKYYSMRPKEGLFDQMKIDVPADMAMIVRKGILEHCAGFSSTDIEKDVEYTHDLNYAIDAVSSKKASAALILPEWRKNDFISAVAGGNLLSQKSTFFYPKIPSGIAIYKP